MAKDCRLQPRRFRLSISQLRTSIRSIYATKSASIRPHEKRQDSSTATENPDWYDAEQCRLGRDKMASPVLWQNSEATVTLIDVPRSIAAAQGTVQHPCLDHLVSSPPPEAPFQSTEPKSAAAYAKLLQTNAGDGQLHGEYAQLLEYALKEVRTHHHGEWCLPRLHTEQPARKRKRNVTESNGISSNEASGSADHCSTKAMPALSSNTKENPLVLRVQTDGDRSLQLLGDTLADVSITNSNLVYNRSDDVVEMVIKGETGSDEAHYRIPPKASFCPGDCNRSQDFRASIREEAQLYDTRRKFDLILLDPPWPNRSVRRTHKTAGSTYSIASDLNSVQDLLLGPDLDMLMAENALVGVWITNKPAVRELVLGEDGIFATWGVQLVEEWVWLKTTVHGEPVTPLDAVWRKSFEVLLLGRVDTRGECSGQAVKRRIIVGVPDLHSRKPCLKSLLEPLLADKDYRALEVFARHLVAGWCSWGDECVKFNERNHWHPAQ